MEYLHLHNEPQTSQLLEQIIHDGIKIQDNAWESVLIQASGAFFGALFAFLLGLIALWIQKKRQGFITHKNAIFELECLLWEHLDFSARNQKQIKNAITVLKKDKRLTHNRFDLLRSSKELNLKLRDISIINPYATYLQSVERINSNIETLNRVFDMWFQGLLFGKPPSREEIDSAIEQMEEMLGVFNQFDVQTKELLVFVRIYFKRVNSWREKSIKIYKVNGYTKITNEEIAIERKRLDDQLTKSPSKT